MDIIILRIHSYIEGSGWISLYSVYIAIQKVQVGYHYTPYTQLIQRVQIGYTPYTQLYRGFSWISLYSISTSIQRVQVGYTPYTQLYTEGSDWIHNYTEVSGWISLYSVYTTIYRGFRLDIIKLYKSGLNPAFVTLFCTNKAFNERKQRFHQN